MRFALLLVLVLGCARGTPGASAPAAPAGALDPLLTTYAYPEAVAFTEVATQQQRLRMAYVDAAPAPAVPTEAQVGAGKVVLLLHGKNFSAAYWSPTIQKLTAEGYRVIAPDQLGFGKSAKPAHYQFSFEALADTTRQLLDSLGVGKVFVVGHSMGGMLATRFALMYPSRVERLVLVNPLGLEDWRAKGVPSATIDELFETELAATPASIKAYMREAYFAGAWQPAYDKLVEVLAGWTRHPRYREVAWDAALTADMIFTQPVIHDFPRVQTPTLLIIGDRDKTAIGKARATKEIAATLGDYAALGPAAAKLLPHGSIVVIEGAGHLPQLEQFDAYASALLGFLHAR